MDMPIRTADEVELDRLNSALGFLMRLAQLKIYERFFEEVGEHNLKPGNSPCFGSSSTIPASAKACSANG